MFSLVCSPVQSSEICESLPLFNVSVRQTIVCPLLLRHFLAIGKVVSVRIQAL
jgi:hypothetical protein